MTVFNQLIHQVIKQLIDEEVPTITILLMLILITHIYIQIYIQKIYIKQNIKINFSHQANTKSVIYQHIIVILQAQNTQLLAHIISHTSHQSLQRIYIFIPHYNQLETSIIMDQWKVKLKKILHLQQQQQQQQQSTLPSIIGTFFKKHKQSPIQSYPSINQHQHNEINEHSQQSTARQIIKQQQNINNTTQRQLNKQQYQDNKAKPIIIETQIYQQNSNTKVQHLISQQKVMRQPLTIQNNNQQQQYQQHQQQQQNNNNIDSDEDSLGYTQNDWDQQTINFQLQDRLLDCLEDQKYVNQYRQSLAQSSLSKKHIQSTSLLNRQQFSLNRKSIQKRQKLTKLNRPPSPKQIDMNQLDFDQILLENSPNPSSINKNNQQQHAIIINTQKQSIQITNSNNKQQNQINPKQDKKEQVDKKPQQKQLIKTRQNQRKNRFSKYKKKSMNINRQQQQKVSLPKFTPQQEEKINLIFKQKGKILQNESCDDYIARVFKVKTYQQLQLKPIMREKSNKQQLQQQRSNNEQKQMKQQSNKCVIIKYDNKQQQCDVMIKKQSIVSQGSFQVIQGINHLTLSQQIKKSLSNQDNKSSSSNQFKKQSSNYDNQLSSSNQSKKQSSNQSKKQSTNQQHNQSSTQQHKHLSNQQQQQLNNSVQYRHNINPPTIKQNQTINDNKQYQQHNLFINEQDKFSLKYKDKKLPIIFSPVKNTSNNNTKQSPYNNINQVQSYTIFDIQSPIKEQTQSKNLQQPHINPSHVLQPHFIKPLNIQDPSTVKMKPSPQVKFEYNKSPLTKIQFNYVNPHQNIQSKPILTQNHPIKSQNHPIKPQNNFKFAYQQQPRVTIQNKIPIPTHQKLQPQPEDRIPIFLQRLRRLISIYPNFNSSNTDLSKIRNDLKIILNAMKSSISVIQLLFKKMKIQKNKLLQPFVLIQRSKNSPQNQRTQFDDYIWDFFMNSGWQNYKIQEIDFIKPKQKFKRRILKPQKVEQGLKMYNNFIDFYLKQEILITKSEDEIKRYIRIRQKISQIVQYLRMISQDLYSYWIVDCHYPSLYYEFLRFLKLDNLNNSDSTLKDEIFAKLIQAQQYNDPLSCSIVGRKIIEKVQQSN